jgi:hypothetical protein
MKNLANDKEHCISCGSRWSSTRRNREAFEPGYKEEWYMEQCLACIFFIRLTGFLIDDFGVCSCEKSKFDGIVRFEHDGCEEFIVDEDLV